MSNRRLLAALVVLLAVGAMLLEWLERPQTPNLPDLGERGLQALTAAWQRGEAVALVRHVERCDRSDSPCLDGSGGISVAGKAAAEQLGHDFARLLPVGNAVIYHSPVKRTEQTAGLAFGTSSEAQEWLRSGCKQNLYDDILRHKQPRLNLVLVTHSTCIDPLGEAQGHPLVNMDIHGPRAYGAVVFLSVPPEAARLRVIGYLYADQWRALMGR